MAEDQSPSARDLEEVVQREIDNVNWNTVAKTELGNRQGSAERVKEAHTHVGVIMQRGVNDQMSGLFYVS